MPLSRSRITTALAGFGRRDVPGLRDDEYLFTLPEGVADARVEDGVLVLSAAPNCF